MLTLADARPIAGATVYRDVSWADGSRALTGRFYVLPDEPTLAVSDASSAYTLYRYRGAPGSGVGGGLLVLGLDLAVPDGTAAAVAAAYALPAGAEPVLAATPFSASTATVTLAGESGPGEFVTSVTCTAGAGGTVALVVVLTADGVALVDQAMSQGLPAVHAELDLAVDYVLDDISLRVWCDYTAAVAVAGDMAAAGSADGGQLLSELRARGLVGTTLLTTRPLSADEQSAVATLSAQALQSAVLPNLLDGGGHPRPGGEHLAERSSLTLTASSPGVLAVTRTANLLLPDGDRHTVSADLGAAGLRRFVRVGVAGDLSGRGISLVEARLDYAGTLADGTALTRRVELVLRPDAPAAAATFDIATPEQRAVTTHLQVHYADGSASYAIDLPAADADSIDVDVDALGVLAVEVAVSGIDPTAPAVAVIDLAYGPEPGALSHQLVLDGAQSRGRWLAPVREVPQPYRYRVTWIRGSERDAGEWQESDAASIALQPPFAPVADAIAVLSAGPFDQLAALVVELRAGEGTPITPLRFTGPDQSQSWSQPAGTTGYQYRTTLVRADGSHQTGAWVSSDGPVLVVRDGLRFDVALIGNVLGLGTTLTKAIVDLQSPDPAATTQTVVLDATTTTARAAVRLVVPDQHAYRYRLTLCPPSQPAQLGDWLDSSSPVLVLRRPA